MFEGGELWFLVVGLFFFLIWIFVKIIFSSESEKKNKIELYK